MRTGASRVWALALVIGTGCVGNVDDVGVIRSASQPPPTDQEVILRSCGTRVNNDSENLPGANGREVILTHLAIDPVDPAQPASGCISAMSTWIYGFRTLHVESYWTARYTRNGEERARAGERHTWETLPRDRNISDARMQVWRGAPFDVRPPLGDGWTLVAGSQSVNAVGAVYDLVNRNNPQLQLMPVRMDRVTRTTGND